MIKLTDRLQVLADQIEENETMADIGTDHGFLPIHLWETGVCPKVVLADISVGSLDKARLNAQQLYPGKTFDLRLGNGIQTLEDGEVDAVVIAGMGGVLMTRILGENLKKSQSFKKLILQPRNGQGQLRYWLTHNGFGIIKESLVQEGKYICEIITAVPEGGPAIISHDIQEAGPQDIEYEVPPWIVSAGSLVKEFIERKRKTEEEIRKNLDKSKVPEIDKIEFTEKRIIYLNGLLGGV